jgi:hypothetical protein
MPSHQPSKVGFMICPKCKKEVTVVYRTVRMGCRHRLKIKKLIYRHARNYNSRNGNSCTYKIVPDYTIDEIIERG